MLFCLLLRHMLPFFYNLQQQCAREKSTSQGTGRGPGCVGKRMLEVVCSAGQCAWHLGVCCVVVVNCDWLRWHILNLSFLHSQFNAHVLQQQYPSFFSPSKLWMVAIMPYLTMSLSPFKPIIEAQIQSHQMLTFLCKLMRLNELKGSDILNRFLQMIKRNMETTRFDPWSFQSK